MNVKINDLGVDPERKTRREDAGCTIGVFVDKSSKAPDVIFNADTPEREREFAAFVAGFTFDVLKRKFLREARSDGVRHGGILVLNAVHELYGEEGVQSVLRKIDEIQDRK